MAADLKAGVAAYRAGDYETALREFTALAEDGNAHAEFNLAILYLTGRGVEKDIARSIELHRSAADRGLPAAMHGLGVFYYQGTGVKQDYEKALEWFRKSAALGFADSEFNLGVMYFNRQGVEQDDVEVIKWVTLAASRKFAPAEFRLGQMYETGVIFQKNPREALHWYRLAQKHGNKEAGAAISRVEKTIRGPPLRSREGGDQLTSALNATVTPPDTGKKPSKPDTDRFAVSLPAQETDTPPLPIPQPPDRNRPAEPEPATTAKAQPVAKPVETATAARTPDTRALPDAPAEKREWRVQFASFRTEAEVEEAWQRISAKAADALGDAAKISARADLGERGVYHRLQVGPMENRAAAIALCERVKAVIANQNCLPVRTGVR
ncbi:MAG: SPOR domain-containing protein [Alphaproteobacteria bacterium]